ncbi:MAG: hypothetical protein AAFQ94_28650 [Bacteroidota bacterium]
MKKIFLLSGLFLFLGLFSVSAQEKKPPVKDTTDYFSDYDEFSYLWEDSKAKAKAEKKRKKAELKKQKALAKQKKNAKDTTTTPKQKPVSADTLKSTVTSEVVNNKANADVQETTPLLIAADTIPKPAPTDTLRQPEIPLDTLVNPDPELSPFEQELEEERKRKEKEKKEKKEKNDDKDRNPKDIQDFRAGLGNLNQNSLIRGGFTFTRIDDQNFVGLTLNPEFNLGKVGVGLNVPILYGLDDQSFRTDIFEDGIGIGRLITYIRYGTQKKDPLYVRVGELTNTMIGFGGLVNNYSNAISFEKRKVGLHYDFNVKGIAGIEGMYSDFDASSLNLFVLRPYVRPLAKSGIPIINTFEIGATFLRDNDQTKRPVSDSTFVTNTFTEPGIGAFGIDAGVTLLRVPFIQIDLFTNYSRLNVTSDVLTDSLNTIMATTASSEPLADGFENGTGFSVGLNFRMHFILDVFSTDVRIERLSYSEHYLPQFFDTSYELNKDGKILSLANAQKQSGIYGSLTGQVLQKVRLGGSLLIPDEISETSPAVVRLNADLDRLADKFSLHASYFKGDLTNLEDAFKLDERSIAKVRFIYHMNKYLAAGLDYYWAFARVADGSFQATRYVSPYFGLNIEF